MNIAWLSEFERNSWLRRTTTTNIRTILFQREGNTSPTKEYMDKYCLTKILQNKNTRSRYAIKDSSSAEMARQYYHS